MTKHQGLGWRERARRRVGPGVHRARRMMHGWRARRLAARLDGDPAAVIDMLPDFLGLGAPRAGTTWLHQVLRDQPEVFVPRIKEVRYFSRHLERGPIWYALHFADAADRRKGEISTEYAALQTDRISAVHELLPDARLLYVLRDPVERAWSQACHDLAARRGADPGTVATTDYLSYLADDHVHRHGAYAEIIARWRAIFEPAQLWIGFYDDLRADPYAFLSAAMAHIGAAPNEQAARAHLQRLVNPSGASAMPAEVRRAMDERYAESIARLRELLHSTDSPSWLSNG